MAAAVETASTMEAAATVEAASSAAVEATTAVIAANWAAVESATDVAVGGCASVAIAWAIAMTGPIAVAWAAIETVAVVAVIPRTGADEHATYKPARTVVAIGRAGVRIIAVVTIGADRRWSNAGVHGTYADTHSNLGVSASRGKKQNPQQCSIF